MEFAVFLHGSIRSRIHASNVSGILCPLIVPDIIMLIVISPAKTLDFESQAITKVFSQPDLLDNSEQLINTLRKLSPANIASLMKLSDKLALLNFERYQDWQRPFNSENAKQAVLAFQGDVYTGLEANRFSDEDLNWAQQHLRILSGLYGVLRPLDLIQPYRLEMGSKLANAVGKNLYEFWGNIITDGLNQQLKDIDSDVLVNLASREYFKSVQTENLNADIITPDFKDWKNGQYKIISFYAKKARGMMSRWIINNRIDEPQKLKDFDVAGYRFDENQSTDKQLIFIRDEAS